MRNKICILISFCGVEFGSELSRILCDLHAFKLLSNVLHVPHFQIKSTIYFYIKNCTPWSLCWFQCFEHKVFLFGGWCGSSRFAKFVSWIPITYFHLIFGKNYNQKSRLVLSWYYQQFRRFFSSNILTAYFYPSHNFERQNIIIITFDFKHKTKCEYEYITCNNYLKIDFQMT